MQQSARNSSNGNSSPKRLALLLSSCSLLIGAVGYFSLPRDQWLFYVAAHLGALGVMGLFGVAAGFIAVRKQRHFTTAFLLGSLLPIVTGLAAVGVFLLGQNGRLYCGGSVCLAVALAVVISYLIIGRKSTMNADELV